MGKIKKSYFLYLFIFCSNFVFSQKYEIEYDIIMKNKSNDTIKQKESHVLLFDLKEQISTFYPKNSEDNLNAKIYKNFKKNKFYKYEKIINSIYRTNFNSSTEKWKLTHEEKIILNNNCQSAIINFGGRDWKAWYSKEIAYPDGPYKFTGLPGIILEIYSTDGDYSFTANSISKSKNLIINDFNFIPIESKQKEFEIKKEIIKDPIEQYRKIIRGLKNNNLLVKVYFGDKEITQDDMEKNILINFEKWRKEHNNPIEKEDIWLK